MLPSDSEASARGAATIFSNQRVRQFYDPNQYSGKAIAESIGWSGKVAWDIYLFYLKDSEWVESPPIPAKWMHRLREDWADPEHFYTDDDLIEELYKTMRRLLDLQKSNL